MPFDLGPDEVNDLIFGQNGGQSMQLIGLDMLMPIFCTMRSLMTSTTSFLDFMRSEATSLVKIFVKAVNL